MTASTNTPAPAQEFPSSFFADLAPWKTTFLRGVPIIMYHKLGPRPRGLRLKANVLPNRWFVRQMTELSREGFCSVSVGDFRTPGGVVLTFDDGSLTVMRHGLPVLERFGMRACQYLVAGQIGGHNAWDTSWGEARDELMGEDHVREWLSKGHEIGSHTLTHAHLAKISVEDLRREIIESKTRLEDRFQVPIRHFCYPYGNCNQRVRDTVEEAGYETAVTTETGISSATSDPFLLPRVASRHPTRNFRSVLYGLLGIPLKPKTKAKRQKT